ncbi:hypothetical protein BC830DRAFT_1174825 [Chytriomyces sp. MP71]|nr:hypothetical protein BC830DRAFT_1174825 [Chytriomyces sp. MP71]
MRIAVPALLLLTAAVSNALPLPPQTSSNLTSRDTNDLFGGLGGLLSPISGIVSVFTGGRAAPATKGASTTNTAAPAPASGDGVSNDATVCNPLDFFTFSRAT